VTLEPVGDGSFTAVFVAEFNLVPSKCAGRSSKVTGGSFIMIAKSEPFFFLEDHNHAVRVRMAVQLDDHVWEGEVSSAILSGRNPIASAATQ
jgi:hypothetical protein